MLGQLAAVAGESATPIWKDPKAAVEKRVDDLVIATIGLWGGLEELESMDRSTIEMSELQLAWLKQIRKANPNVVCVVHVGSSLAMKWAAKN